MLAIALSPCAPVLAEAPKKAPPAVQAEFTAFMSQFAAALKANDAVAVAGMAKRPFEGDADVSNAEQFKAKIYKSRFSASARACLQRSAPIYDRDQENNDIFLVTCGDTIFYFTRTPAGFLLTDVGEND